MKESTFCDMRMEAYYAEDQKLEDKFDGIKPHHILRWDNEEANTLARLASSHKPPLLRVFVDVLDAPSICLEGTKGVAPAGAASTLSKASGGTPSHQECVLVVTTHSHQGTKPLTNALPNQPVGPQSTGDKSRSPLVRWLVARRSRPLWGPHGE